MYRSLNTWFEKHYDSVSQKLISYSFVISKNKELAKDAVADVFLDLMKRGEQISEIKDIESYLFTCVKHRTIALMTKPDYRTEDLDLALYVCNNLDPSDLLAGEEMAETIDRAKNKLSDKTYLVYKLVKEENLSYEKVSIELSISKETVKFHLKKALKTIRQELEVHNDTRGRVIQWIAMLTLLLLTNL